MSVDAYIALLKDLTLPLRVGGQMISGPPDILFVLGAYVKTCKLLSVGVTVKKWNKFMLEEYATASMTFAEIHTTSENRVNSFKGIGSARL